jgi:hypothetical protein
MRWRRGRRAWPAAGAGCETGGCLRFAFYGRVSTEDWQDPVTSLARQLAQAVRKPLDPQVFTGAPREQVRAEPAALNDALHHATKQNRPPIRVSTASGTIFTGSGRWWVRTNGG